MVYLTINLQSQKNNNEPIYYTLQNNEFFTNNLLREASKHDSSFQMTDDYGILGKFTVNRGEDERGKYFSYYDSYDINPYKGDYSKFNSKKEDISMGIGNLLKFMTEYIILII